jgi:tyrosine-protein kinase Etk/Wzc
MAKLDESKNYPLIQVLDKASLPEERSKPKRGLIVTISASVAFFLAVFFVYWREKQMRSERNQ